MTRAELAHELRERQKKICKMIYYDAVIDVSDEIIIEAYITCCICGEREITEPELSKTIESCSSVEDWVLKLENNKKCIHSVRCVDNNPYNTNAKFNNLLN